MGGPDSMWWAGIPAPRRFRLAYRSPMVGLDNRWDLWTKAGVQPQAVISIRGTAMKQERWLQNLYAAMLPATGELQHTATRTFAYRLATNPQAAGRYSPENVLQRRPQTRQPPLRLRLRNGQRRLDCERDEPRRLGA